MVIPILIIIVFGIIEMSMALRDYAVVASNTRVGARIASTGAGSGQCPNAVIGCTASPSPVLAQAAANAIQRAGSAMPKDNVQFILIYKANADGFPGSLTSMPSTCPADCVKYMWVDSQDRFRYESGSWVGSSINACFPGTPATATSPARPLDRVGVYVRAKHPFITGLFGASVTLSDHTVQEFEPMNPATCASGEHA